LNRAGVPLMEIVTMPDLSSSEEAAAFLKKLQNLLRSIGTCTANMDEGELRCDVNVSVNPEGGPLGTRCEVKNVNSIKFVMKAIEYEIQRQLEILKEGGKIEKQTRGFDADKGITIPLRRKEDEVDYRMMPEPDLPPLQISSELIEAIRATLPELPDQLKNRFMTQYGLSAYEATILVEQNDIASYYEQAAKNRNAKRVASWIINDLSGLLKRQIEGSSSFSNCKISPERFGALMDLLESNYFSGPIAKEVLALMFEDMRDPKIIADEKGLFQTSDEQLIREICQQVLQANQDDVARFKQGKNRVLGFLISEALKISKGRANPKIVAQTMELLIKQQ